MVIEEKLRTGFDQKGKGSWNVGGKVVLARAVKTD